MPGRWTSSQRRAELPPDWPRRRARILRRDRYRCQWRMAIGGICGAHANQVDHIRGRHDHRDTNLRALCQTHHDRKSSAEGHAAHQAARARQPTRTRAPEPHPGTIRK